MIRFLDDSGAVGAGHHRCGWKYAMEQLVPLVSDDGVLLDDFVDKNFGWAPIRKPHQEPWIGVFHKPPNWPDWLGDQEKHNTPSRILTSPLFQESARHLRLAITFSKHLGDWLRDRIKSPVVTIPLPTTLPNLEFAPEHFTANPEPAVVQVGYVLRNLRAIHQLNSPSPLKKVWIRIESESARRYERQVGAYWDLTGPRPEYGDVHSNARLDNMSYDELLSRNIVFLELFDSSANNTIIECIVRRTPLVVNRLPAIEEYLGADYPLFYEDISDADALLNDSVLFNAHKHLSEINVTAFSGEAFRRNVQNAIDENDVI
ncbi:MAG: hypothetical protein KDB00_18300 [Planctomycetales bacterium]|nr:hypothetical protein [Planctomycetales bacterium]